jgi:hypothetical protein
MTTTQTHEGQCMTAECAYNQIAEVRDEQR